MLDSIINFIAFHPEITLIGAITIIQVAPIKFDPWGMIARAIKKYLVGEIETKVDNLSAKVDGLDNEVKENKALSARAHILRFADELYNKKEHSKEYFDEILDDIDKYEKYCVEHPNFKNNKTVLSTNLIKTTYDRLISEHKF